MTASSRRRRGGSAGALIVIRWRDIPAQVNATRGDEKAQCPLPDRFQHAIDRAAGVAGLTDTQSYVAQWRQDVLDLPDGEPQGAAESHARALDAAFSRERLEALVAAGGLTPSPTDRQDPS